jgi:RNA polymerase sigma-70 factor (family 1)
MQEEATDVCEENTFGRIHKDHNVVLANFLYYKVGDMDRARDIAQEAFIRLWNHCKKVTIEKAKSFLFTVANRLFLDEVAHHKVVLKFQNRTAASERTEQHNPEFLYRHEEFKDQLEEAVSALPEKQRTVFLMSRIDKMTNQQIAEALEVSIKTVEKHITSSLKALRESLDELKDFRI